MVKTGKSKKNESNISDADTLVLDDKQLADAQTYKTYGSTPGAGGLDDGEYVAEITDFERSTVDSKNPEAKTNGAPKFMVKLKVVEGDASGRKTPAYFATAAPGQAASVLRLLDIIEVEYGKEISLKPLVKSAFVGKKVRAVVSTRAARKDSKAPGGEWPARKECNIFPLVNGGKAKKEKTKISK